MDITDIFVMWLNSLSIEEKTAFHMTFGNPSSIMTSRENNNFVYYKELVFNNVIVKDITSQKRMPNGSFIEGIEFMRKS